MPIANQFRHQTYSATAPTSPHRLLNPESCPLAECSDFQRRMRKVGASYRAAGVRAIYLVHGTFGGSDMLGVLAELARIFPSAGQSVRRVIKRIVNGLTGEVGCYTERFARRFERAINGPEEWGESDQPAIPVRLFHWSSENHHVGRADGAIRLIEELASLELQPPGRVLLWGHSHAGNVFALVSNLLPGDPNTVERFFRAAEIYYRWPLFGCVDIPIWRRVQKLLLEGRFPGDDLALDMVTFGTPIRYGWDSSGYSRLMHFINHRPVEGLPEYRAAFPPKLENVLSAAEGDYVQQLGIAGTNIVPSRFAWRAWLADSRLKGVLQPQSGEEAPEDLVARFRSGTIVPEEGLTLLVDYGHPEGTVTEHLAGHAVYTRAKWLLFHAEEVARQFYPRETRDAA